MSLVIQNLSKRFDKGPALLENVSFEIQKGEIVGLVGQSGSGKTTLLNCIAGLDEPCKGEIVFQGTSLLTVPTAKRSIGYMMQDQPLYDHLTVEKNVGFPLRNLQLDKTTNQHRLRDTMHALQLEKIQHRKVVELSGGERRRVALGRAIIKHPNILLLDEPFISLDESLQETLQSLISSVHQSLQSTCIIVSHDSQRLAQICDRVIALKELQKENHP